MYSKLNEFIAKAQNQMVSNNRQKLLQPLIDYIQQEHEKQEPVKLNFVCTHNSRRSQLSQVWAKVLGDFHKIDVSTFSGGVEVTGCHPNTVESLKRVGFKINKLDASDNPRYQVFYSKDKPPIILFSKLVEDPFNPKTDFGAIMTCDHANEACPIITGAARRIPITYKDPKQFDNTSREKDAYDERSLQIAAEMNYVFLNLS